MISIFPGLLAGLAVAAVVGIAGLRRSKQQSERAAQAEAHAARAEAKATIAESKAAQAQAEARQSSRLAELGTLTGVLAHEIKNPLSTVGLNLQLLQEDLGATNGEHDRLRGRLAIVQRETSRLREILDDFLRYAGKLELDRKSIDLNLVLEELSDFFAPQAQLAHVQLRLRPHPSPVIADVDVSLLKQAILNLMINAVQAMNSGGDLILSASAEQDGQAVINVIDTGPGIDAETLDKIFQAYYSTKRGGTGLGLAMARRIAQEHGGTLTVQSELGKGTHFSLRLPMIRANAAA
jgi:signal transduction histidine kinase